MNRHSVFAAMALALVAASVPQTGNPHPESLKAIPRRRREPHNVGEYISLVLPEPPVPNGLERFEIDGEVVYAINLKNAQRKAKKK